MGRWLVKKKRPNLRKAPILSGLMCDLAVELHGYAYLLAWEDLSLRGGRLDDSNPECLVNQGHSGMVVTPECGSSRIRGC